MLVDGVNVKEYDLEALYAKIGYVSQKAVMFTGTVADNVAFGQNADESKLTDALEISHSADFISELEDKENAHMARGGTKLLRRPEAAPFHSPCTLPRLRDTHF